MATFYGFNSVEGSKTDEGRTIIAKNLIVQNGLVLNLDAGVSLSYPRSGTTWTNLTGGNNAALVNSPTFDSGSGGSIVFDGSNDYGTLNTPVGTGDFSYNIWIRRTSTATGLYYVFGRYADSTSRGCMIFILDNSLIFRIGAAASGFQQVTYSSPITGSNWTNISVSANRTSNALLYRNGVFNTQGDISSQQGSVPNLNYIGSLVAVSWFLNASIGTIQVYNRALTAQEHLRNFNCMRSRFGV